MSQIGEMRANIVAKLAALPALANVRVLGATAPDDWIFHATKAPCVLVVHAGLEAAGPQNLAPRTQTGSITNWLLICISTDYQSGTGALTRSLGTDDLVEAVRAIRGEEVGPASNPRVSLHLRAETLVEHPDRNAAGGPVAYFCNYQSSHLVV